MRDKNTLELNVNVTMHFICFVCSFFQCREDELIAISARIINFTYNNNG